MSRKALVALLLVLGLTASADAQLVSLERDSRIRTTIGGVKRVFRFIELRSDSLSVTDLTGRPLVLALRDIDSLEVRTGRRSAGAAFWQGTGIGLVIGGALGAILGLADGDDPPGFFSQTAGEKAAMLGIGFGLIGAAIGGIRALIVGTDRWQSVPLPEIAKRRTSESRLRNRHVRPPLSVVLHQHVPGLTTHRAVLDVILVRTAPRIERDGVRFTAIGTDDSRIEIGRAVTERKLLVQRVAVVGTAHPAY